MSHIFQHPTLQHPTVTLSNGVRVANFSSPHPFTFDDGSTLAACDKGTSLALNLDVTESEVPHPTLADVVDIAITFTPTPAVLSALEGLDANPEVDVVLVPFPVLDALKRAGRALGKARVIRSDRISRAVSSTRFCI